MKRVSLVIDERLLATARRLSGERAYSRTVERALKDFVRRIRAGLTLDLAGSGLWEGDLGQMRGDRLRRGHRRRQEQRLCINRSISSRKSRR